ncbi:MAG: enoyl-CoA hydratase-related protein [Flavobacteriales bacterium]|nr:enoyl-CoA hydratase-related protein [Flavobacteriales bacterium]
MQLNFKNILVETEGRIQSITINRPSKLNALDQATIKELSIAIQAAEDNNEIKVILITGAGEKAFVAGADISEFSDFSVKEGKILSQKGHQELFSRIDNLSKPVIAAVNGFALGGGLELALSAHIRIFSENARVGLPETSLGVIPGYGGTQRLAQIAGKGRAMQMILSAEMIDASTALKYGITTVVVPQEDLIDTAKKMANKIMKNAPSALTKAIQCINASYSHEIDGFGYEIDAFGSCFDTPDFKEGTKAFLEKRKANF